MPVYLDIVNLIIDKKAIIEKYAGGIDQCRIDFNIPLSEINHEDDELFCMGQMNADQFDIDLLVSRGLSYDTLQERSDDFTILSRFGEWYWEVPWLRENSLFAWHIDTPADLIEKMEEVSNMTMYDIVELGKKGIVVFKTIKREA